MNKSLPSLQERDRKILWHPFTQEKNSAPLLSISKASGAYLYDENENSYLDLISSWWVNLHGHSHPKIAEAIYNQAQTLEHVLFAGCTHEPAVQLCEALSKFLPKSLSRFFFSDNGSTAVEVALKMSYQYWHNQGILTKKKFLCFEGGYHGDTFGAMSVSSTSKFHQAFANFFFETVTIPFPATWYQDSDIDQKEAQALEAIDRQLDLYGNEISAFILEPLIQGASGMRMCRPQFLNAVLKKVHERKILIIFDEVMTGFYRTGTLFALDQLEIKPDFLCISKGLTGGFLPLALTITKENIYEVFLSDHFHHAFAHGHTYTANPIACRAALTSLELLQEAACQKSIQAIHQTHQDGIKFLQSNALPLEKFRICGTVAAFDSTVLNDCLYEKFISKNLLIRPLGKSIYLLPPYCIRPEELEKTYSIIGEVLTTS